MKILVSMNLMERIITYSLAENFIQNLSHYIEENFLNRGKDITKLAFVFGGKRPSLFLKRELSKKIGKGFFSPHFFSVDEFVEYILYKKEPFLKISDLDACFTIYTLAKELTADVLKGQEGFSKFLPWAREVISFIEQLDLEDIRIESLKGIQEKARIGYDVPEGINRLLESIITLREAYYAVLKKKGVYSRGLIYLLASQYIHNTHFDEFDQIFFCGLFYLHKTEQEIIKTLYDVGKAVFFFQGSSSEWSMLERVSRKLSSPIVPRRAVPERYTLHMHSAFDVHSQVCTVREILRRVERLDNAVVVVPQVENIIPLLSEISGYVSDFNISMGYPLKRSSLYSLFECIFKAQDTKKDNEYYAKDYLRVLSHPLIKNLRILPHPSITRVLVHKIEEILVGIEKTSIGGMMFIKLPDIQNFRNLYDLALSTMKKMDIEVGYDELKAAVGRLHDLLFYCWEQIATLKDFSLSLEQFLDTLVQKSFLGNYPLNLKMAEKIFSIREEFYCASFNQEPFTKEEIFKIFIHKLENEMISFSGSPLKGLQILGLFETRSLNFENVIVMDANESVLPNLKIYEPLIPREVMIMLELNSLEKEEEIQRYHFRRLISGAKNVYLIYQQRPDKEKSRFIEEIIWNKQKSTQSFESLQVSRTSFSVRTLPKKTEIKKTPEVIQFLEKREYSASSINTYMRCPLRFYYQYVLGLKEREDLLEETEAVDIGIFVHGLLEESFSRFVGKKPYIGEKFKKDFFDTFSNRFAEEFEKKMKSDSFLIKEMLIFSLRRFLESERKRAVLEILALEKTFKGKIEVAGRPFNFKAVIDRIDRLTDGHVMILDYKTGSTENIPEKDVEKIESAGFMREALKKTVKSFQLPLYLYFVGRQESYKDTKLNAALYSIRDTRIHMLFKVEEDCVQKDKFMNVYLKCLDSLMCDILNPNFPFKADEEDTRQCENCAFFYLCR